MKFSTILLALGASIAIAAPAPEPVAYPAQSVAHQAWKRVPEPTAGPAPATHSVVRKSWQRHVEERDAEPQPEPDPASPSYPVQSVSYEKWRRQNRRAVAPASDAEMEPESDEVLAA